MQGIFVVEGKNTYWDWRAAACGLTYAIYTPVAPQLLGNYQAVAAFTDGLLSINQN